MTVTTDDARGVDSSGAKYGHPRCEPVARYRDSLSTVPNHEIHCNTSTNIDDRQHSNSSKAEYLTDTNGTVVVTSDGRSPLRLTCENGCPAEVSIEH